MSGSRLRVAALFADRVLVDAAAEPGVDAVDDGEQEHDDRADEDRVALACYHDREGRDTCDCRWYSHECVLTAATAGRNGAGHESHTPGAG